MCIRDRAWGQDRCRLLEDRRRGAGCRASGHAQRVPGGSACLLYTSDAADERSSVDLGGRRTIKKKKN